MNNKPVFKRVFAFIFDILIVALITSLFTNIEVLNPYKEEYNETYNKLYDYILNNGKEKTDDETTTEEKTKEDVAIGNIDLNSPEILDLQYDLTRYSLPTSIISLVVTVLYFVLFQYFNNGKTIGKALFKMRVTNKKGEKASITQMIIRAIFVDSILTSAISILLICYMTKDNFLVYNEYVATVDTVVIMACLFFMLFRKDARGFHDLIAGTEVNYIDSKKIANVVEEKPVVVKEETTKLEVAEPKKTTTTKKTATKKATTKKTTTTKKTATKKPVAKKTTTTKKATTKKTTVKKDK